jgi:hypothetical protein
VRSQRRPSLGQEIVLKVLNRDGGGAKNVSSVKPEHLDRVYEAFERLPDRERGRGRRRRSRLN